MEKRKMDNKEEVLVSLFEGWWNEWPTGQKTAKKEALRAWMKVFKKDPGIPEEDWATFAEETLNKAIVGQIAYRTSIFKKYPDQQERKRADIFVPRLPMPSTWLNQGRWSDPIQQLEQLQDPTNSGKKRCVDCEKDSFITYGQVPLCEWHYTRRFDKKHLRLLADTLADMGLARLPDESSADWGTRCRDWIRKKGGSVSRLLGA
jgi:hypothetical protein